MLTMHAEDSADDALIAEELGHHAVTQCERVFITNVKGTFFGMSESEEASKRR
jgi:hypothetical protein